MKIYIKTGGLKVRSTEEYLGHSWFAYLPILPGSAAGAAALNYFFLSLLSPPYGAFRSLHFSF